MRRRFPSLFLLIADRFFAVEPAFFEVIFSKTNVSRNEFWRVCIELNDEDRALLETDKSPELKARSIVRRSGILDLLPKGLDDGWTRFGTVMEHNVIGTWNGGREPIIAKDGHKVWVIARGTYL
jgi:hypothetical protein